MKTRSLFIFITLCVVIASFAFVLFNKTKPNEKDGEKDVVSRDAMGSTAPSDIPPKQPTPTLIVSPSPLPPSPSEKTPAMLSLEEIRRGILGEDKEKREEALSALSSLLEKNQGKEILMEIVGSDDQELLSEALRRIPKLAEADRILVIMKGLENDRAVFRQECLSLLRDIVSADVNDVLMRALQDESEEVQGELADLINYFSDRPIYQAAFEGLKHSNSEIRDNAVHFFWDHHTAESVELLIHALESSYPDVVIGAGDALRFITDAKIKDNLIEDWRWWWESNKEKWTKEKAVPDEE